VSVRNIALDALGTEMGPGSRQAVADIAYRRAWWSLMLYPVTFVAAFVIGEFLFSMLDGNNIGDPAIWTVLVSATPALLIFVVPGVLAVLQGRTATALGRPDGRVPAIVGAVIGVGFVGLSVLSYIVQTIFG
jgi:Na+-driven multidrug efflux pump